MNPWCYVAWGAGWMLLHFAAYTLGLRFASVLQSERGIFSYHAGSFLLVLVAGLIASIHGCDQGTLAAVILVLSAHAIYSTSFLESWSLTQGGYSLRLLSYVAEGKTPAASTDSRSTELGASKVRQRLESLERLSLIRRTPGGESLTTLGGAIALALRTLFRLTGGRSLNR